jgi:hypothetical protein
MTEYFSKLTIDGTEMTDVNTIDINDKVSYAATTIQIRLENTRGAKTTTFKVGDEIIVYCDENNPPTTVIFKGQVTSRTFFTENNRDYIQVLGMDYTLELKNSYVQVEVYNNDTISDIVTDLVTKYTNLTTTNVQTLTKTLNRQVFKEKTILEALKELARLGDCDFYVDYDKDVHFFNKESVSSGITFDNKNTTYANFEEVDNNLVNSCRVRGGTYLVGQREDFTCSGTGSVYTLNYKPKNTRVTLGSIDGATQNGGVYEMVTIPPSGTDYLVSYNDKKIVFVSGTECGDNIPASGTNIFVQYDRQRPIITYKTDPDSISQYGVYHQTITEPAISDPSQAKELVKEIVRENSLPKYIGTIRPNSIINISSGQTAEFVFDNQNVNITLIILDIRWNITKQNLKTGNILELKVGERIKDLISQIADMQTRLRQLEVADAEDYENYTRLFGTTGSVGLRMNYYIKTRDISGLTMFWNSLSQGTWGTHKWGTTGSYENSLVTNRSGGYFTGGGGGGFGTASIL